MGGAFYLTARGGHQPRLLAPPPPLTQVSTVACPCWPVGWMIKNTHIEKVTYSKEGQESINNFEKREGNNMNALLE